MCNVTVFTKMGTERLSKDWNSPIYAFFKPMPDVDHIDGCRAHVFECNAKHCKGKGQHGRHVRRYLDTGDAKSTRNLRCHAKICWSEEAIEAMSQTKNVHTAQEAMAKATSKYGSITVVLERAGKNKATYSHRQHSMTESRYVPQKRAVAMLRSFLAERRLSDGFQKVFDPLPSSKIEAFNLWWRLGSPNATYLHLKQCPTMSRRSSFGVARGLQQCCRWVTSV